MVADGIHAWSAGRYLTGHDALEFFPALGVETDGAHAFYLGSEFSRAETAWRLGKRYVQDEPLDWGVAVPVQKIDKTRLAQAGHTLRAKTAEARRADDP